MLLDEVCRTTDLNLLILDFRIRILISRTNKGNLVTNLKTERLKRLIVLDNRRLCQTILDHLRKKGLQTEQLKPYDTYGIIDEYDLQERSEIEARLWTAIDSLPEKCREVFLLSKRDGLKYEEIAAELEISENTVRNQISKALKILKEGAHKIYMFFFA